MIHIRDQHSELCNNTPITLCGVPVPECTDTVSIHDHPPLGYNCPECMAIKDYIIRTSVTAISEDEEKEQHDTN